MKVLLASAVLVFSTIASATSLKLPAGSNGLTLLTQKNVNMISVVTHMPNCPKPAMCEPAAVLKITFTLGGCMSKLGPVTMTYAGQTEDGKMKYLVTAYELENEKSQTVKCIRAPIGIATQVIGMGFLSNDSVEVQFAESLVNVQTL